MFCGFCSSCAVDYKMPNDRILNVLREAAVNKQEPALAFYLSSFHSLWPPKAIYIVKSNYPGVMREHLISDLSRAEHIISPKKGFSQMKVAY